jgi:hypothetical protein
MMNSNTVTIYAAGGCGINLASKLGKEVPEGFANMEFAYVDTSRSNMTRNNVPENRKFLIKDSNGNEIDGSGKERSANIEHIRKDSERVLTMFKPSNFNLVIHSINGGSGSVIGPVIVAELIKRGLPVIVLLAGSSDSTIEIDNGIKTMQSYDAIAKRNNVPVICHCEFGTWSKVDKATLQLTAQLLALLSGNNHGMDTADLTKWLNLKVVGHASAKLYTMDTVVGEKCLDHDGKSFYPISVATLVTEGPSGPNNYSISPRPDYQAMGIVPKEWETNDNIDGKTNAFMETDPLHFVVSDGIHTYYNLLDVAKKEIEERIKTSRDTASISKGVQADDDGMVL